MPTRSASRNLQVTIGGRISGTHRAGIVLASVQGRSAAEAAAMFAASPQYAREVIHAFNEKGFAALDPKWSGAGRVRSIRRRVSGSVRSLGAAPVTSDGRSRPGACRNFEMCLRINQIADISGETLRKILE